MRGVHLGIFIPCAFQGAKVRIPTYFLMGWQLVLGRNKPNLGKSENAVTREKLLGVLYIINQLG